MNSSTSQTSGNKPPSDPSDNTSRKMLEQMAESFGIDMTEFGDQAEEMWNKLTEMHESDPASYQSFLLNQMEQVKNHSAKSSIVPEKGFVVKTIMRESNLRKKVFINFCQHEAVRCPVDDNGERFDINARVSNVEIPLVTSALREFHDSTGADAYAIDVVVHPWCLTKCSSDGVFKNDIIALGMSSIEEDRKIHLDKQWKVIKSQYKGGVGQKGNDVHPFPMEGKKGREGESKSEDMEKVMEDPSTLLSSLHSFDNEVDPSFSLKTERAQSLKKTSLIQEIATTVSDEATQDDPSNGAADLKLKQSESINSNECHKAPAPTLMKELSSTRKNVPKDCDSSKPIKTEKEKPLAKQMKGFLNRSVAKRPIYEEPSTGDGASGDGGAYSRLLSKCKVVDTAKTVKTEKERPPRKNDTIDAESVKQMFSNLAEGLDTSCITTGEFRNRPSASRVRQHVNPIELTQNPTCMEEKKQVRISHTLKECANGSMVLEVDLSDTKASTIGDVEIEIVGNSLTIRTSCGGLVRYSHPRMSCAATAKLKKKKRQLLLTF